VGGAAWQVSRTQLSVDRTYSLDANYGSWKSHPGVSEAFEFHETSIAHGATYNHTTSRMDSPRSGKDDTKGAGNSWIL